MTGENPYAPPAVAETETVATRYWRIDGIDVLARNGATLPKVDLDSGVSEGALKGMPQVVQVTRAADMVKGAAIVGCYIFLRSYFDLERFGFLIPLLLLMMILKRLGLFTASPDSVIRIWIFIEERRARRTNLRRWLRVGVMVLAAVTIFVPLFLTPDMAEFFPTWIQWILPGGILCIIALAIWGIFDRPRTRTRVDSPGWLRISRIHSDALAFLRTAEEELMRHEAAMPAGRKRLVRTVYYHRYPLRMLIGHRILNPFFILQCALMKYLRSRLLVRDAWHFSEAEETPLDQLCPPLRQAAMDWLGNHPGWTFVTGERLPSPAGDLIVESAGLASPGLEHCARISHTWMEQRPGKGITHFNFITWLRDGTHAATWDQPYLALKHPHLHQRASGSPELIYQKHLRHTAGLDTAPSFGIGELRARLLREKEETDRLLTERKLQSEVREAA